jgi:hypothetical protein
MSYSRNREECVCVLYFLRHKTHICFFVFSFIRFLRDREYLRTVRELCAKLEIPAGVADIDIFPSSVETLILQNDRDRGGAVPVCVCTLRNHKNFKAV